MNMETRRETEANHVGTLHVISVIKTYDQLLERIKGKVLRSIRLKRPQISTKL